MAEQPIAKSFLGILRLAHIKEKPENQDDELFNPYFYGEPSELIDISGGVYSDEIGYQSAEKAFNGEMVRYSGEDYMTDRTIPITDSRGNYLNWNSGENQFTIGSNEDINGVSRDEFTFEYIDESLRVQTLVQESIFPVLKTSLAYIGLQPMVIQNKVINRDQKLTIESTQNSSASLIINNYFDCTNVNDGQTYVEDNYGNKFNFFNYSRSVDNKVYRTVLRDKKETVEPCDAFIYHQDNYNYQNYHEPKLDGEIQNDKKHRYVDAIADVENMVEYVKQKIGLIKNGNFIEVPTGSVIWQYCSIDKWYGINTTIENAATDVPQDGYYPANNPPMERQWQTNSSVKLNVLGYSTIQGVSKGNNHIYTAPNTKDSNAFFTIQCSETQPLYKRDYALCNGSEYSIYFHRKMGESSETKQHIFGAIQENDLYQSYDRFINLFFSIGYEYTPQSQSDEKWCRFYDFGKSGRNIPLSSFVNFDIKPTSHEKWTNEYDRYVIWGSDLACAITYRKIAELRAQSSPNVIKDNIYSYQTTIDYLKQQKFNSNFIFNSFIGWSNADVQELITQGKGTPEALAKLNSHAGNYVIEHDYNNDAFGKKFDADEYLSMKMLLGREVNSYDSPVLFYNITDEGKPEYFIYCLYQLPPLDNMLKKMEELVTSTSEKSYFETYYRIDFRVPDFTNEQSGSFMGSTLYTWSDDKMNHVQTKSWSAVVGSEIPHRHYTYYTRDNQVGFRLYTPATQDMKYDVRNLDESSRPSAFADYFLGTAPPESVEASSWRNYVVSTIKEDFISVENNQSNKLLDGNLFQNVVSLSNDNIEKPFTQDNFFEYKLMHQNQQSPFRENDYYPQRESSEPNRAPTSVPHNQKHLFCDYNYYLNGELYNATNTINKSYSYSESDWDSEYRAQLFVPMSVSMLPLIKL